MCSGGGAAFKDEVGLVTSGLQRQGGSVEDGVVGVLFGLELDPAVGVGEAGVKKDGGGQDSGFVEYRVPVVGGQMRQVEAGVAGVDAGVEFEEVETLLGAEGKAFPVGAVGEFPAQGNVLVAPAELEIDHAGSNAAQPDASVEGKGDGEAGLVEMGAGRGLPPTDGGGEGPGRGQHGGGVVLGEQTEGPDGSVAFEQANARVLEEGAEGVAHREGTDFVGKGVFVEEDVGDAAAEQFVEVLFAEGALVEGVETLENILHVGEVEDGVVAVDHAEARTHDLVLIERTPMRISGPEGQHESARDGSVGGDGGVGGVAAGEQANAGVDARREAPEE